MNSGNDSEDEYGSPIEKSIETVFSGNELYLVPKLQRDYSWGNKQIDDLITDINFVNGNNIKKYYFGPAVLISEGDNVRIIDGQQRLSTFLLFFRIIKDFIDNMKLKEENLIKEKKDFSEKLHNLIFNEKKKKSRVILGLVDQQNFEELLCDDEPEKKSKLVAKNLKKRETINPKLFLAYKKIFNYLNQKLKEIEKNIVSSTEEEYDHKIKNNRGEKNKKLGEKKKIKTKKEHEKNLELKKKLNEEFKRLHAEGLALDKTKKKFQEEKQQKLDSFKQEIISQKFNYLKKLEESISQSFTILQFKEDYEDAHLLFETLNNRGLNLSQNDLIKNQIIKFGGIKGKDYDIKWKKIKEHVGLDLDSFLADFCTMIFGYTAPQKLYKKFKAEYLNDPEKIDKLINDLLKSSKIYKNILKPEKENWHNPKIVDMLNDLNKLNSVVFRPLILFVKKNEMQTSEIFKLTELCLKTFVNFKTIGNERFEELKKLNDEVIEFMKENSLKITPEITNKFKKLFDENRFDKLMTFSTKRNETMKILLKKIYFPDKIMNTDDLELEHIIPQKVYDYLDKEDEASSGIKNWLDYLKSDTQFEKEYVYYLGNTALVTDDENKRLLDNSFEYKKGIYADSEWHLTKIINPKKWNYEEIKARQKILTCGAKKVWKLNF